MSTTFPEAASEYSRPIQTKKYLFVGSPAEYNYTHLRLPFIVTKYLTPEPFCEVHAMTPDGEAWLMGRIEDVKILYRQIVRAIYGMDAQDWSDAGGRIRAPSGSTWDESLEWLPNLAENYAIPLGET